MSHTSDCIIVLYVDTAKIFEFTKKDKEKVLECIYLSDNQFDKEPIDKTQFTSKIRKKSKIAWVGAVHNMTRDLLDYVLITKVKIQKDYRGIKIYRKKRGSGQTHVDGKVNTKVQKGEEAIYKLYFTVQRNGESRDFVIDPKLRVH